MMLFRQLEYFVAVAREQHFARAAKACYVSQPALSAAIAKLENELGVSLINRGHSFGGLTPEGERLVIWARRGSRVPDSDRPVRAERDPAVLRAIRCAVGTLTLIPQDTTTLTWSEVSHFPLALFTREMRVRQFVDRASSEKGSLLIHKSKPNPSRR